MFRQLNRFWRILATGFCFAVFGVGGLLLTLFWFPLQRLVYRDTSCRKRAARKTVHYSFKFFVALMHYLGAIHFTVRDREALAALRGQLILANHPSLIDVVVLISVIPDADCVVKAHLFKNPFMRGVIESTGYISNQDPEGLLVDCEASLRQGNNLIVFPEGTRTLPGAQLKFKRGAANIALRCNAPVTSVLISMQPSTLTKGTPWYRVAPVKAQFSLQLSRRPINNDPIPQAQHLASQARHLTRELEDYFTQELSSL